jgi:hypothetical protein
VFVLKFLPFYTVGKEPEPEPEPEPESHQNFRPEPHKNYAAPQYWFQQYFPIDEKTCRAPFIGRMAFGVKLCRFISHEDFWQIFSVL